MIDITRLRLLRTVVATGSIRASATTLGYTPSAASQQLAALQRETGLQLVERVGRGIELTAAGRALAAASEDVFEELARLDAVVDDLRAGRVGSLSIGYISSVGALWLPPIVDALRTEFPQLRLELRTIEIGEGRHDIEVFTEETPPTRSAAVAVHRLTADPYVVAVRADDPIAGRLEVPLAALADRNWIDNEQRDGLCRQITLDACTRAGIVPRFQIQAPDYRTALTLVATGIGITVLPRLAAADLPPDLVTVGLTDPTPIRHIRIAIRKPMAHNPAARRAVELFTAVASAQDVLAAPNQLGS
ncbi:LysR family transcriptional regulator [Nocardia pseudobrasiliensis]|uniref:DNA-binding transcriptional LysR family regulator n=1 Tax=Nocardia pseudobrasiliensis TaxID=45979 RepID=A0A370I2Z6_9NOCA|nr:LysR family transcriptional regulator [Nocardia pseudobrasiliensis]RDI65093.1 DNA-binding transcriptional LysR family regulator [Nocardia pseudobrasiliensis]